MSAVQRERERRPTVRDVAARAGVSSAAVSYALNQPGRLPATTEQRVWEAARSLGYARNGAARALRRGSAKSIGVLLPQSIDEIFANPYWPEFVRGVGGVCVELGLTLLLVPPSGGRRLDDLGEAVADGFIVCGLEADGADVEQLTRAGVPLVLVDSGAVEGVPRLGIDDRTGMAEAARHVLSLGHRSIGVVAIDTGMTTEPAQWRGTVRRRIEGVADALAEVGMALSDPRVKVTQVPSTREGGVAAVRRMWRDSSSTPTALLCFSDTIAIGAITGLRSRGVDVPQDVSIVGFDDIPEAQWCLPPLTTVHQPAEQKGELAARALAEAMAGTHGVDHTHTLPARLVLRGSTAPLA